MIVLGTFKMAMTLLDSGSRAADAGDGEFERAGPRGRSRRSARRRKPGRAGARNALDDLADADRPAIATTLTRRQPTLR